MSVPNALYIKYSVLLRQNKNFAEFRGGENRRKAANGPSGGFRRHFYNSSAHAFSQQQSKDLRTEHGLERFSNVLDRDRLQTVLLLHIVAHMRRDDTALESQPCNLGQALVQMAHRAYLTRQADLTDAARLPADRQIL